MLKPNDMQRVFIAGTKSDMRKVIDALYKLGSMHIIDHSRESEENFMTMGNPYPEGEGLSESLVKIRSISKYLNVTPGAARSPMKMTEEQILSQSQKLYEQVSDIQKHLKYIERVREINEKNLHFQALSALGSSFDTLAEKENFVHYIGFTFDTLDDEEVEAVTKQYKLYLGTYEDMNVIALFAPKAKKQEVLKLLNTKCFADIEEPYIKTQFPWIKSEPSREFVKLGYVSECMKEGKKSFQEKLEKLKKEHSSFLISADDFLSTKIEIAEAPLKFATSENTFVINGWVPKKVAKTLEKDLTKVANNKIYISIREPEDDEAVPTVLDNPGPVKPFEFFINMYALPKYKEIDPTFLMFLTFPLFFGFMLGDMGYGVITFIIFWLLKKKMPAAKDALNAMLISSASSIFFGFLFGEVFGLEEIGGHELFHVINRARQPTDLLMVSLAIGLVHVNIGLILGFINELHHHGLKKAINAKLSWIVLQAGVALLYLAGKPLPIPGAVGGIVIVISLVMIVMGEGFKGIVEIPSLLSNLLSYARLMAVGLAGVSLAIVVNEMAANMFKGGIFGILSGILVLLLGHVINLVLCIFSPFIHSLRLHYVELFTKFYEGGGFRYKAFGTKANR